MLIISERVPGLPFMLFPTAVVIVPEQTNVIHNALAVGGGAPVATPAASQAAFLAWLDAQFPVVPRATAGARCYDTMTALQFCTAQVNLNTAALGGWRANSLAAGLHTGEFLFFIRGGVNGPVLAPFSVNAMF